MLKTKIWRELRTRGEKLQEGPFPDIESDFDELSTLDMEIENVLKGS